MQTVIQKTAAAAPLHLAHCRKMNPSVSNLTRPRVLRTATASAVPRFAFARRSGGDVARGGRCRSRDPVIAAALGGGSGGTQPTNDDIKDLLAKYELGGSGTNKGGLTPAGKRPSGGKSSVPAPAPCPTAAAAPTAAAPGNGVFLLLVLNIALFAADHLLHLPGMSRLYLNHARPEWYQWVAHAFCHANWQHLSANLFNLCVFGKLVEELEGGFGVVFTYLVCAVGAAAFSFFLQPAVAGGAVTVSLGASGAIFGLFMVSVLARLSWDPRRLLEAAILGSFVVRQVMNEAAAQASGGLVMGGLSVSHLAHLGGAAAGVVLVLALRALPEPSGGGDG